VRFDAVIEIMPEAPQAARPESLVPRRPLVDRSQLVRCRTIDPPATLGSPYDQVRIEQHAKML